MKRGFWTSERKQEFRDLWPTTATADIAAHFGVSHRAAESQAKRLGLRREKHIRAARRDDIDIQRDRTLRCDRAFKTVMLAAIKSGTEHVIPGVVRNLSTRFIPTITPHVESGYRSSAGYTADQGVNP